jgi:hypothetical protein
MRAAEVATLPLTVWTPPCHRVDNRQLSPEPQRRDLVAVDDGGQRFDRTPLLYAAQTTSYPQSTTPITAINLINDLDGERACCEVPM